MRRAIIAVAFLCSVGALSGCLPVGACAVDNPPMCHPDKTEEWCEKVDGKFYAWQDCPSVGYTQSCSDDVEWPCWCTPTYKYCP